MLENFETPYERLLVQEEGNSGKGVKQVCDRLQRLADGTFADPLQETAFKANFFRKSVWFHIVAFTALSLIFIVVSASSTFSLSPKLLLYFVILVVTVLSRWWIHKLADHAQAHRIYVRVFLVLYVMDVVSDTAMLLAGVYPAAPLRQGVNAAISSAGMTVWGISSVVLGILQGTCALSSCVHTFVILLQALEYGLFITKMFLDGKDAWILTVGCNYLGYLFGIASSRAYESVVRDNYVSEEMRLRAQEQLASYLFHELRNHQNVQSGALNLVAEHAERAPREPFPADSLMLLTEARVHAWQSEMIISNMLDYTKLRAGKLRLTTDPFDLIELLNECVLLVRHMARQKPELLLDVRADVGVVPVKLQGPAHLLKQVIINLLTNAVKYTSTGHVLLRATLSGPNEGQVPPIVISVEDTGLGISPDKLLTIFEPFEQGYKPGTGLGLPFCKDVIEKMGSKLSVSSNPLGGSIFSFGLNCSVAPPMSPAPPAAPTTSPATPAAPTTSPATSAPAISSQSSCEGALVCRRAIRVLIADDMRLNRLVLGRQFKDVAPHALVTEESDGEAALATLSSACPEAPFDIAFLDEHYSVDGLKGTEVTRRFRDVEARLHAMDTCPARRLLIIGCTGSLNDPGHDEAAYAAGQDLILGKPIPSAAYMAQAICKLRPDLFA